MNTFERELNWEDEIKQDSEYILLPEGDYIFTVQGYERARHVPGPQGKLPPCNKAIVTILIRLDEEQEISLKHNLFLHSSMEGLLSSFFGSIGLKQKGEPLRMNWNKIAGKKGVCRIGHREKDGNKYNDIKRMIYAEDVDYAKVLNKDVQTAAAPTWQSQVPTHSQLNVQAAQPAQQWQPQQNTQTVQPMQAQQQTFNFNQALPDGFAPANANVPFK